MNTPEGFRLTSWETGYGDWIASPDWETLRVLPWQDRTALVLCDVIDEATHEEVVVSPRTILKRQIAAAAAQGLAIKAGSEFEYYLLTDTLRGRAPERLRGHRDLRPLQRGLPPPPGDEGGASARAAAPAHGRGAHPHRLLEGRGRPGSARGQHPLRRRARIGRPERHLQARREGDRVARRVRAHVHGQARPHLDRLVGPHPSVGVGRGDRPRALRRRRRPRGDVRPRTLVARRDDGARRASCRRSSRRTSTATSATRSRAGRP